jgi:hypothetical protein
MTTFIGEIGLVSILYAVTCLGAFCVLVGAFCGIRFHLRRLIEAADQYCEASRIYRQAKQVTETNQAELEFLRKKAQEVTEMQLGGIKSLLEEMDDLEARTAWYREITDRQPNWEYQ